MIPVSGLFDKLSFSSFVRHGRVHFNRISLEPSKGLAETTINLGNAPRATRTARMFLLYKREEPVPDNGPLPVHPWDQAVSGAPALARSVRCNRHAGVNAASHRDRRGGSGETHRAACMAAGGGPRIGGFDPGGVSV